MDLICTCGHHYEDHQPPTESEWMRGGIAVREEHEECGICGCTDFEEEDRTLNCPKCGSPVINTLLPIGGNTYRTTWNCYECDIWWDYETGKPITVTTIEEDPRA